MAHILIPTDLSANALNAAIYGINLYGAEGNRFTLMHAYLLPFDPVTNTVSIDHAMAESSSQGLEAFADKLRAALPNTKLEMELSSMAGDVAAAVIGVTEDRQDAPELIVMGTQGASGLQEVLLGTHTADVIKRCHLPVLTIPEEATYKSPKRIVLADDGGPVDRASVKVLVDVARWSQAELMVVRVSDGHGTSESEDSGSPYDALLGALPRSYHTVSGDNVTTALHDMADQSDADLVVVMHRQRSMFEQIFHRSTAARLAMHTHIPMLVLQQGPR